MFEKDDMFSLLRKANEVFPICIPSYKRWDRRDNKTMAKIIEDCDQEIQNNTYLFVREEQYKLYKQEYPKTKIVVLPKVNGLASTRQYVEDYVYTVLNEPYFIDIDDDITSLRAVILDKGKPRLTRKGEVKNSDIIKLCCEISRMAFEKDNCCLGKPRRVHYANRVEYTQTAYVTNKGATPRSVTIVNAKEIRRRGIRRNMIFDPTGDDVGFVAEIAKARGSMFNIECLAYSYVDDELNSVIRNDRNRRALAAYEYDCLKRYPIKDYLRIPFKFNDGSYKFSDIDFTKYRKITGLKSNTVSLEAFRAAKEAKWQNK